MHNSKHLWNYFIFVCDWILAFLLTHPIVSVPVFTVGVFCWPPTRGEGGNLPGSCPQSQKTSFPSLQQHFYPFAGCAPKSITIIITPPSKNSEAMWASRQLFLEFPPGVLRIKLHLGLLACSLVDSLAKSIPGDLNFTGFFLFSILTMEEKFIGSDIVISPDKPAAL